MSDALQKLLSEIRKHIDNKNSFEVKRCLMTCEVKHKGDAFEFTIRELYQRNGWVTSRVGGSHDKGADVLLHAPRSVEKVSFIVQAKNHRKPLGVDDVRTELVKFEQEGSTRYQCQNFKLVSVSGFTKSAKDKLSGFNLDLCDWGYVEKLIRNADAPWSRLSPTIELSASNRETYCRIQAAWSKNRKVAAVQATGTGKSYLIAKAIVEHQGGRVLLMAPRTVTINRQKRKTPWIDSIESSTYHALASNKGKFDDQSFDLIVLDEFHRIGAPGWQDPVEGIIQSNPNALILATSATHIRFLDKCRDIAQEVFNNNVVFGPNLPEAIASRLLPNPTYVTAFYSLDSEIERASQIINEKSEGPIQRQLLKKELHKLHSHWSAHRQVSEIIKKHANKDAKKYIVFCESIEHLNVMEPQVSLWLKKALSSPQENYIRVRSHVVHSTQTESENDQHITAFENAKPKQGEVELLFAVNMLNESLHIRDVDGVFLLRKTMSPVLYLQQIGRTLACDGCQKPVIFDLVDNGGSIKHADFKADLQESSRALNERRKYAGLPLIEPVRAIVHDYVSETSGLIADMLHVFDPWEARFRQLEDYYQRNGHTNIPQRASTLGKWINHQRTLRAKGLLSEEKIQRLSLLNFVWNPQSDFNEQMMSYLKGVYDETGACPFKTGDPDADRWMESMRRMYRGNKLSDDRVQALNDIEFVWSHFDKAWNEKYEALKAYAERNGHANVPKDFPELGRWVRAQRDREETLSAIRVDKLNKVGFRWRSQQPAQR